ncbi:MAG: phosphoenolpyruvate carboxylase [Zetaproteobacteria bacterium]|nr:phosphoenolpyruvate carboxylase [Zetaproteobacteria bacterium]
MFSAEKAVDTDLPSRLRQMVRSCIDVYGQAIQDTFGQKMLAQIEELRTELKLLRDQDHDRKHAYLVALKQRFSEVESADLIVIARIFSLYMEIVNRCESAYRHFRLKELAEGERVQSALGEVVYVFTAHPTEARSENALFLFNEMEQLLKLACVQSCGPDSYLYQSIRNVFCLLLRSSLSKTRQPTVKDEAEQIFSTILNEKALEGYLELIRAGFDVKYRAWVGGDKDGHPLVNQDTMVQSWSISRAKLIAYIALKVQKLLTLLKHTDSECARALRQKLSKFVYALKATKDVRAGDGARVAKLRQQVEKLEQAYEGIFCVRNPELDATLELFRLFPALVVPLEIREDASLVRRALDHPREAIATMLRRLRIVSRGGCPKDYVQGFVLSMTQDARDVKAGIRLVKAQLDGVQIPVIPLFETKSALENASTIVADILKSQASYVQQVKRHWGGKYEVMLGYSDSSKENGTLLSRVLISKTLVELDQVVSTVGLAPLFFHGSGGSLERGGGSIREQTSWWPDSAVEVYKSTVQGEMISRNFGDAEIMKSLTLKLFQEAGKQGPTEVVIDDLLMDLGRATAKAYQELVFDPDFVDLVKFATPYSFLDQLKIGSRPSARQASGKTFKMRAIPWVLCWTQTRILFPTWWGLGSFWQQADAVCRARYVELYQHSSLFKSFMKILGFTLSKVELAVFQLYLSSRLEKDQAQDYFYQFKNEFDRVTQFYQDITGQKDFLWFRKWMATSIRYRSPMIHPLNVIQILSIERRHMGLLREATTGIACGMLTTG